MLEDLHKNFEKLIALYETARDENKALKGRLEKAEADCESFRERIAELEKQIDNLKLAEAFLIPSEDSGKAVQKVDKLIKEIDRCISWLEK